MNCLSHKLELVSARLEPCMRCALKQFPTRFLKKNIYAFGFGPGLFKIITPIFHRGKEGRVWSQIVCHFQNKTIFIRIISSVCVLLLFHQHCWISLHDMVNYTTSCDDITCVAFKNCVAVGSHHHSVYTLPYFAMLPLGHFREFRAKQMGD